MSELIRTSDFANDAADLILRQAEAALAARGRFFLSLSGGSTPKPVYERLRALAPDTTNWVITFGDERCVPPDDAQSNYRMARDAWLADSRATVLRMRGELDAKLAADEYEGQLDQFPDFHHDLILLGIGDDGHTASLFPKTAALEEKNRRVVANYVEKLGVWRVTFTFPFINAARAVAFLVGASKATLADAIRAGGTDFPSERVQPQSGGLIWMVGKGKAES